MSEMLHRITICMTLHSMSEVFNAGSMVELIFDLPECGEVKGGELCLRIAPEFHAGGRRTPTLALPPLPQGKGQGGGALRAAFRLRTNTRTSFGARGPRIRVSGSSGSRS